MDKIQIETMSPEFSKDKTSIYKDYHEKLAWWNSLPGDQQQDWLKIFITHTQFTPIPCINRVSAKNKKYDFSELNLDNEDKNTVPNLNIPESTMEFINHQVQKCKEYTNQSRHDIMVSKLIQEDPEFLEKHGHIVYNSRNL